jgi:hypothetical protein
LLQLEPLLELQLEPLLELGMVPVRLLLLLLAAVLSLPLEQALVHWPCLDSQHREQELVAHLLFDQ